jgi:hypothetical protein
LGWREAEEGERKGGGREGGRMVMSVLWTPKSAGRKGKCSLAATINHNRRKREEGE